MHIKRDISIWSFKTILNVLLRIPGFSDKLLLFNHCCAEYAGNQIIGIEGKQ